MNPMLCPTRRRLLCALGSLPLAVAGGPAHALLASERTLRFAHTHTGEKSAVTYFAAGRYLPDALDEVSTLLRDFRTGAVFPIDATLLDFVHVVQGMTGSRAAVEIISGYRSPETNARLRQTTTGVARRSFHMRGQALDIRLNDTDSRALRDAAVAARLGGVGYYPASDFVHLDTGPVRSW
ncbi:MAG: DUF882 domain-containing protein [Gammaproteobacteria bacterium]|nr:DUF882 domain-containing protein [Gammaproteobacteria bacterium]